MTAQPELDPKDPRLTVRDNLKQEFKTGWAQHEHLKKHFRHSYLTTMQYQVDANSGPDVNAAPDQNVVAKNAPQATYV
jgi:hypothetical protein